jgi:hypothetical protein
MNVVQKCHSVQISIYNMCIHPALLHSLVTIVHFSKWGIDFMTCKPTSTNDHGYIIMVFDYFTKWDEAFPTFSDDDTTASLSIFNHIITRFNVPNTIVTDHGSQFCNYMMTKLGSKLGFLDENLKPYYPQSYEQVESITHVLNTMIQRMLWKQKTNLHIMLFSTLWAYHTSAKTATQFTPFQLIYGMEEILSTECEILSLKIVVELLWNTSTKEECLLYLAHINEQHRDATLDNETHKIYIKSQCDKSIFPCIFSKGDLVLVYDQDHDMFGIGNLEPLWHGPYIVRQFLKKGTYEMVDYDGNLISEPRNGIYLKKYYS